MISYRRPVRFEDVDAARIVFFGHYMRYAHEAMEHFFREVEGGYPGLINDRRVGFPAVKVEAAYLAPLRYGEVVDIEVHTARLGNRSATLLYRFVRAHDQALVAEITHTVVVSDLTTVTSCEMPADVRGIFQRHLAPAAPPGAP